MSIRKRTMDDPTVANTRPSCVERYEPLGFAPSLASCMHLLTRLPQRIGAAIFDPVSTVSRISAILMALDWVWFGYGKNPRPAGETLPPAWTTSIRAPGPWRSSTVEPRYIRSIDRVEMEYRWC